MKDKFSNIYSEEIKERILKESKLKKFKPVYRAIYHSVDSPLCKEDFYPTIMHYNNNEMPSYERQNLKTKISNFSVSVYTSRENLVQYTDFVPSERNSANFIAVGEINISRGTASDEDEEGHINYYLFKPEDDGTNCYHDFKPLIEEE